MNSKENPSCGSESDAAHELVRTATREADIAGTKVSLVEIKKENDPRFGTAEILSQINNIVVFDGRPLLQEDLEKALVLLDTANAIETTQEIIDLRAKLDFEIQRIAREGHTRDE